MYYLLDECTTFQDPESRPFLSQGVFHAIVKHSFVGFPHHQRSQVSNFSSLSEHPVDLAEASCTILTFVVFLILPDNSMVRQVVYSTHYCLVRLVNLSGSSIPSDSKFQKECMYEFLQVLSEVRHLFTRTDSRRLHMSRP